MKKLSTKQLVILGLLVAIVLIMSTTPLGTLPIGPLSITLNMIPIAIAAIAVGPIGGLIIGFVFGMFSFLQAIGMIMPSGLGMLTFSVSPFLTFVQRVGSRALVGFLLGLIFKGTKKMTNSVTGFFVTGFFAAVLNFIFFMGLLVLCFGGNADVAEMWAEKTVMAYLIATFMSNTIFEIMVTTILTGVISLGLYKAKLLNTQQ